MLNELKKQSFRKVLPLAIILIIIGAVVLYLSDFGIFKLIGGAQPLDELPADQIAGKYVSYTVDLLYDSYAYTTEKSDTSYLEKTVSCEYIIPVGYDDNGFFMGLYANQPLVKDLDRLLESSFDYLNGEVESPGASYAVTGTVLPIEEGTLGYFYEAVGYDEGDADYQAMFQPYYLKVDYLGKTDYVTTITMTIISALCLLFGFGMPIRALAGGYQSDVKKFCKLNGDEEMSRLESWYQYVPCINGFRIDERWAMFNNGAYTHLLDTSAIAWVYYRVTTHRRNGIKTGTTYGLIIWKNDGKKKLEIPMSSENDAQETMEYIGNHFPQIVLGYDKDRERRYKQNPSGFAHAEIAMRNHEITE